MMNFDQHMFYIHKPGKTFISDIITMCPICWKETWIKFNLFICLFSDIAWGTKIQLPKWNRQHIHYKGPILTSVIHHFVNFTLISLFPVFMLS